MTVLAPGSLGSDDGHSHPQFSSTVTHCHNVSAPVRQPSSMPFVHLSIFYFFLYPNFTRQSSDNDGHHQPTLTR